MRRWACFLMMILLLLAAGNAFASDFIPSFEVESPSCELKSWHQTADYSLTPYQTDDLKTVPFDTWKQVALPRIDLGGLRADIVRGLEVRTFYGFSHCKETSLHLIYPHAVIFSLAMKAEGLSLPGKLKTTRILN